MKYNECSKLIETVTQLNEVNGILSDMVKELLVRAETAEKDVKCLVYDGNSLQTKLEEKDEQLKISNDKIIKWIGEHDKALSTIREREDEIKRLDDVLTQIERTCDEAGIKGMSLLDAFTEKVDRLAMAYKGASSDSDLYEEQSSIYYESSERYRLELRRLKDLIRREIKRYKKDGQPAMKSALEFLIADHQANEKARKKCQQK